MDVYRLYNNLRSLVLLRFFLNMNLISFCETYIPVGVHFDTNIHNIKREHNTMYFIFKGGGHNFTTFTNWGTFFNCGHYITTHIQVDEHYVAMFTMFCVVMIRFL